MMKLKETYNGLTTTRQNVASSPIMATSTAKIKVKTENKTEPWVEEPEETLPTSITSEPSF